MTFGRRILSLATLSLLAAPLWAQAEERVNQRARGSAPIWAEGEAPADLGPEAKAPAPRRALRAAIAEAVAQATRDFVAREDAYLDPDAAVAALGEPQDRLRYAERYRVVEDLGRVSSPPGGPTELEYALVIEAQVDLARVRQRLSETQLLLFEAPPPATEQQVIVLEGDFSYASYREIRDALAQVGAEIGPHAFERGRIRLELDAARSPEDLVRAVKGRLGPTLWLEPIGRGPDELRVKVVERIAPSPDDPPPAAP